MCVLKFSDINLVPIIIGNLPKTLFINAVKATSMRYYINYQRNYCIAKITRNRRVILSTVIIYTPNKNSYCLKTIITIEKRPSLICIKP